MSIQPKHHHDDHSIFEDETLVPHTGPRLSDLSLDERATLLLTDSDEYIRRMTYVDQEHLMSSLARAGIREGSLDWDLGPDNGEEGPSGIEEGRGR